MSALNLAGAAPPSAHAPRRPLDGMPEPQERSCDQTGRFVFILQDSQAVALNLCEVEVYGYPL